MDGGPTGRELARQECPARRAAAFPQGLASADAVLSNWNSLASCGLPRVSVQLAIRRQGSWNSVFERSAAFVKSWLGCKCLYKCYRDRGDGLRYLSQLGMDKYRPLQKIGRGAYGDVHLVEDLMHENRKAVLKVRTRTFTRRTGHGPRVRHSRSTPAGML